MLQAHEGVLLDTEFSILSKKQQKVAKLVGFINEHRRTSSSVGAVGRHYLRDLMLLEVANQRKL